LRNRWLVLALSLWTLGSAASAATLNYTFVPSQPTDTTAQLQFTSHFDTLAPFPIANLAPIFGSASVTLSDAGGIPIDGPATLNTLVIDVHLGEPGAIGTAFGLGGEVISTLLAPVSTTWTAGSLASAIGLFHVEGQITCDVTAACGVIGLPPVTNLNGDGNAPISATATATFFNAVQPFGLASGSGSSSGQAYLYGVVPEPGALLLLGMVFTYSAYRRVRS